MAGDIIAVRARRQKLGIYCTKAQKFEIEFAFYKNVFYEKLDIFMSAFINAQDTFTLNAPKNSHDGISERCIKIAHMAGSICFH